MGEICELCRITLDIFSKDIVSWYCDDCGISLCDRCYIGTLFGSTYIGQQNNIYIGEQEENNDNLKKRYETFFRDNKIDKDYDRLYELEKNGHVVHRPADSKYFRKMLGGKIPRHAPENNPISDKDFPLETDQRIIANDYNNKLAEASTQHVQLTNKYVYLNRNTIKDTYLTLSEDRQCITPTVDQTEDDYVILNGRRRQRITPTFDTVQTNTVQTNTVQTNTVQTDYYPIDTVLYSFPEKNKIPPNCVAYRYYDIYPEFKSAEIWKILRLELITYTKNIIYSSSNFNPGLKFDCHPGNQGDPRLIPVGYNAFIYRKTIGKNAYIYKWKIINTGIFADKKTLETKFFHEDGYEFLHAKIREPFNDNVLSNIFDKTPMYLPEQILNDLPNRKQIPQDYVAYDSYKPDTNQKDYSKIWRITKLADIMGKPKHEVKSLDPRLIPAGYEIHYFYKSDCDNSGIVHIPISTTYVPIGTIISDYIENQVKQDPRYSGVSKKYIYYFEIIDKKSFDDNLLPL